MQIRSCIALYDLDMRRYIPNIIDSLRLVLRHIIRTARHVQKYVPGSDCVGILVYAKRSNADFNNENMTFLSTYNINYVT